MKPRNNLNSPKENGEEITTTEIKKNARKNECVGISKWSDKEVIREYNKKYRQKHKLKIKKYFKDYAKIHGEKLKEYHRKYRVKNSGKLKQKSQTYYQSHKTRIRLKNLKNKPLRSSYNKKYYVKNKRKLNQYRTKYLGNRYKKDTLFKIKHLLRSRIGDVCKGRGFIKSQTTIRLLGCNLHQFKLHIESLFKEGMSWDNHGRLGWHIDHIIPLASANGQQELERLCHYKNLQPLWWYDNLSKSGTIPQK